MMRLNPLVPSGDLAYVSHDAARYILWAMRNIVNTEDLLNEEVERLLTVLISRIVQDWERVTCDTEAPSELNHLRENHSNEREIFLP